MPIPWGALLSSAGSLIGGLMGDSAAEKANKQQVAAIQAQNRYIKKFNAKQFEREDNFIQRRVADARAAGIHPLAALGASVAGSFATPQAAYGGAPITGSAVGDALKSFGENLPIDNTNAALQTELLKAQIKNVNASTTQLLADATSRTTIAAGRNAATSGAVHELGAWDIAAKRPGAAQRAQDDFGDLFEQVFGAQALGDSAFKLNPERAGPLSKNFWEFIGWLRELNRGAQ